MGEFIELLSGLFQPDQVKIKRTGKIVDPYWISKICDETMSQIRESEENIRTGKIKKINSVSDIFAVIT
jgi:hypothetical protein